MIDFDHLVHESILFGYEINEQFQIPKNIPILTNGYKVEYLTKGKEIPIIFCKTGFPERCMIALVGDVKHNIIPIDSFTIIEKLNKNIIEETLNNYGVT